MKKVIIVTISIALIAAIALGLFSFNEFVMTRIEQRIPDCLYVDTKTMMEVVFADAPIALAETNELITIPSTMAIYSEPDEASSQIDTLNTGDVVAKIGIFSHGWIKIIYSNNEAYIKSIDQIEGSDAGFTASKDAMYVLSERAEVDSVNRSNPVSTTLSIQTQVVRVGVSEDGRSKILHEGVEYYIQTDSLSFDKPVIWTYLKETQTMYVGDFDGIEVMCGYKEDAESVGTLNWIDSVDVVANGDNGWSKIVYNDNEAFVKSDSLIENIYPIVYEDETGKITITREWYENAWCYAAHLEFTDYTRFGTSCANGKYGRGNETTSNAAKRLNAIFCVNGCYSAPYLGYGVARSGVLCNNLRCFGPAVYSFNTGVFSSPYAIGVSNKMLSTVVANGRVTDTFWFGPPILTNGYTTVVGGGGGRAQRTFIGTNGNPGDIWVVVSDGRKNDGESSGLTYYQCTNFLKEKGCSFGVPLDGGGSSTFYFNGRVLNAAAGNERAVVDFVYFK